MTGERSTLEIHYVYPSNQSPFTRETLSYTTKLQVLLKAENLPTLNDPRQNSYLQRLKWSFWCLLPSILVPMTAQTIRQQESSMGPPQSKN